MKKWFGLGVMLWVAFATGAYGAESIEADGKTFLAILEYGWQINAILGVLLFLGLFLVFFFTLTTRESHTVPRQLFRQVLDDLASGEVENAQKRLGDNGSLLAQTIMPGLKLHDHPHERILVAMEGAGRRALGILRQRAVYLSNIGVLAPMLGLLGTVMGLLDAFNVLGEESLREGSKSLMMAAAIGKAMGTTAVGLIVGIPAMAAHFVCMSRLDRIGSEVETAAEEVAAALHELK